MALVAFCPTRSGTDDDLQPFERLAVRLSGRVESLEAAEAADTIALAVEDIGTAFGVDECTLLAYGDPGDVSIVHAWAAPPHTPCSAEAVEAMPWLVSRVARNTVAAVMPGGDVPQAAARDRALADQSGVSRLAVPVVVNTRVAYGVMLGTRQRHVEWRGAVIERLRLLGHILGTGLDRVRSADLARPSPETELDVEPDADGSDPGRYPAIVGASGPLRLALARLRQVAPLDATVLLLGETGTGKELFARAAHEASKRRRERLVCVNCAALPATLIESELFGHERGAFTGATGARQGRFEMADKGTIFLDEIGDLAPELQAKLLRVLQEGEFERVGSSTPRRVDARVIAATHVDLQEAVAAGRFRADLYYRLSVFPITLPPLRERREDIPRLVWSFVHQRQRALGRRITSVPPEVMQALQRHDWPGNVRELENVVARALIRSSGGTLQLDDAPLRGTAASGVPAAEPVTDGGETLDAVQRRHIERVLRECGWRINGAGNAAVRLGMHPNTLRFRIKKLGVALPEGRGGPIPASAARS